MTLTASGRAALAQALPIWTQAHAEIERLFAAGEADSLRTFLDALSRLPAGTTDDALK
jgi:DNA-binding MarR family transcriptional regulator